MSASQRGGDRRYGLLFESDEILTLPQPAADVGDEKADLLSGAVGAASDDLIVRVHTSGGYRVTPCESLKPGDEAPPLRVRECLMRVIPEYGNADIPPVRASPSVRSLVLERASFPNVPLAIDDVVVADVGPTSVSLVDALDPLDFRGGRAKR